MVHKPLPCHRTGCVPDRHPDENGCHPKRFHRRHGGWLLFVGRMTPITGNDYHANGNY